MYRVLLVGETCIDQYVYGVCDRACPEAPALIFTRSADNKMVENVGMAGNVLRNIKSIDSSIKIDIITNNEQIIKRRYIDKRYNAIAFREDINNKIPKLLNVSYNDNYDIVVISDYNKGFLDIDTYQSIRNTYPNSKIFADTKRRITPALARCVDCFKINGPEYDTIENKQEIIDICDIVATNGEDGAYLYRKNLQPMHFTTPKIEVKDVCGAGDTFLAALVVKYLETRDISMSIPFANECASKVCQKFGVAIP